MNQRTLRALSCLVFFLLSHTVLAAVPPRHPPCSDACLRSVIEFKYNCGKAKAYKCFCTSDVFLKTFALCLNNYCSPLDIREGWWFTTQHRCRRLGLPVPSRLRDYDEILANATLSIQSNTNINLIAPLKEPVSVTAERYGAQRRTVDAHRRMLLNGTRFG